MGGRRRRCGLTCASWRRRGSAGTTQVPSRNHSPAVSWFLLATRWTWVIELLESTWWAESAAFNLNYRKRNELTEGNLNIFLIGSFVTTIASGSNVLNDWMVSISIFQSSNSLVAVIMKPNIVRIWSRSFRYHSSFWGFIPSRTCIAHAIRTDFNCLISLALQSWGFRFVWISCVHELSFISANLRFKKNLF